MPSSISGVFEHTSGVSGSYHLTVLACSLFMRKESKFQMIRRIKFSTVSKIPFLHTHLQICVLGYGYRIVFPVLCLCLIVETKDLNTYSTVFWYLAVRSVSERQGGIRSLGVTRQILICLLLMREEAGSWRNPVYLSSRCGQLLREKKAVAYNGAHFNVQTDAWRSVCNRDSRRPFMCGKLSLLPVLIIQGQIHPSDKICMCCCSK